MTGDLPSSRELILERAHQRHGQVRQLRRTDERHNVGLEDRRVGGERGALDMRLGGLEPLTAGVSNGDRLAACDVDAVANFCPGVDEECVGVLLEMERALYTYTAFGLIPVVDDPSLFDLALRVFPGALT
jgi:hypothetical protein